MPPSLQSLLLEKSPHWPRREGTVLYIMHPRQREGVVILGSCSKFWVLNGPQPGSFYVTLRKLLSGFEASLAQT